MNLLKPEILTVLAGEYVLGTLQGGARRRFERLMAEQPEVEAEVRKWQESLQPLAVRLHPVEPSERLWQQIEEQVRQEPKPFVPPAPVVPAVSPAPVRAAVEAVSSWWKGLAIASSAFACVLLALVVLRPAGVATDGPGNQADWRLWSVLVSQDRAAQVVVVADETQTRLWVMWAQPHDVVADKSLELWLVPQGEQPQSLGVIPRQGVQKIVVPVALRKYLSRPAVMAVSLEPAGGSPRSGPTGPVLFSGPVVVRTST